MKTLDLKKLKITNIFWHFRKSLTKYNPHDDYNYICLLNKDAYLINAYYIVRFNSYLKQNFNKKIFIPHNLYNTMRQDKNYIIEFCEENDTIFYKKNNVRLKVPNEIINFENKFPIPPFTECNILFDRVYSGKIHYKVTPELIVHEPVSNIYGCVSKLRLDDIINFAKKSNDSDIKFYCTIINETKKLNLLIIDCKTLFAIIQMPLYEIEDISKHTVSIEQIYKDI